MNGPGTAVRVTPDRGRADEWAVVLAAAGIPHWLRQRLDGWALVVPPDDAGTALQALDAYDTEAGGTDTGPGEPEPARPLTIVGAVTALGLVGMFAITGPRAAGSAWFVHGSADAERLLAGEWWRALTALTLHADAPHLVGNAVALAALMTAVCSSLGPGVGAWLLLAAGGGGNVLTALVHGSAHVSVGASTAVFAAVGILAALRITTRGRSGPGARRAWVVVAAALAILAMLGTGPHTDLLAHVFGVLAGGVLGLLAGWWLPRPPSVWVQWPLLLGAAAAVVGAWRLAL
jgi:rhomboid protease GluP